MNNVVFSLLSPLLWEQVTLQSSSSLIRLLKDGLPIDDIMGLPVFLLSLAQFLLLPML